MIIYMEDLSSKWLALQNKILEEIMWSTKEKLLGWGAVVPRQCEPPKLKLPEGVTEPVCVYKVVHRKRNGTYVSCWAGKGQPRTELGYVEDCITTAPEGSEGIFTQDTLANAILQSQGKLGFVVEPTAILEVLCLGKKNRYGRYNQVFVVGEVYP